MIYLPPHLDVTRADDEAARTGHSLALRRRALARRASQDGERTGRESLELVPVAGTPSYCLVFSIAESGVVRQLTMNADDASTHCEPGKPIGGQPFRIPAHEGKVRIYTIFSDQKLAAPPIAEQVRELGSKRDLSAFDLRAPGRVITDTLEFVPEPAQGMTPGSGTPGTTSR